MRDGRMFIPICAAHRFRFEIDRPDARALQGDEAHPGFTVLCTMVKAEGTAWDFPAWDLPVFLRSYHCL